MTKHWLLSRASLFYLGFLLSTHAQVFEFNPVYEGECAFPSFCSITDNKLWIPAGSIAGGFITVETSEIIQLYVGIEDYLHLQQLTIRGNATVFVYGILNVTVLSSDALGNGTVLYDAARLTISEFSSFYYTDYLILYDFTKLRIIGEKSSAFVHVLYSYSKDATILVSDGDLGVGEMSSRGTFKVNGTASVYKYKTKCTDDGDLNIVADSFILSGTPNIGATIIVNTECEIVNPNTYFLDGLILRGHTSVTVEGGCPANVAVIGVYDNSSVSISSSSSCPLGIIIAEDNGVVYVNGGTSWTFDTLTTKDNAQVVFTQPDTIRSTSITALVGRGNFSFQGTYIANLGQKGRYIPGLPDNLGGGFVLTNLTVDGTLSVIAMGLTLYSDFLTDHSTATIDIQPGQALILTTPFNIANPSFTWSPSSYLQLRGYAVITAGDLTLREGRTLSLQTQSTTPNIYANTIIVTDGSTLSSEFMGVVKGDVVILSGTLDLSWTFVYGTFLIDGDLRLTSNSTLRFISYFDGPPARGMTLNVTGDVILDGLLVLTVSGGPPSDYTTAGKEAPILTCSGKMSGKFSNFQPALSGKLSETPANYSINYKIVGKALYITMAPTPRTAPPVPTQERTSNSTVGVIIGCVVGGVILVALVVGFLVNGWIYAKKNPKELTSTASS